MSSDKLKVARKLLAVHPKWFEALGIYDETVVIVTSDHGEDLGLHGLWGHGTLHETTVRVPLILRDPRGPKGRRVSGFVQHVDDLPTILEYFPPQDRPGFGRIAHNMPEVPDEFDGQSLLSLVRGEREAREEIVVESEKYRAYISPPWKLIWSREGKVELFNLDEDPLELCDRSRDERAALEELSEKLRLWVEENLKGERTDPMFATDGAWTCYIGRKEEGGVGM